MKLLCRSQSNLKKYWRRFRQDLCTALKIWNWFKAVCTDLMSRLFKTNTIGLDITKQIFHIGGKIIPKLIKNVFEVVFKKIANGTSRILSLLEALRLTTANIGRQFLIMPLHTFNTNIIEGILFFIKTFLLWIMNSFVLIWLERRVIHNVWHIWAEIRILSQLEWMKTAISLVSKPITSLQLKMCRS